MQFAVARGCNLPAILLFLHYSLKECTFQVRRSRPKKTMNSCTQADHVTFLQGYQQPSHYPEASFWHKRLTAQDAAMFPQ